MYWKVPVVGRLNFEFWESKIKIGPKVDIEISQILESSILSLSIVEGFDAENCYFHVKMDFGKVNFEPLTQLVHFNVLSHITLMVNP